VEDNPTQRLAKRLDGTRAGGLLVSTAVLDVSFERSCTQLREQVVRRQPRAMIHLGVAREALRLRLEQRATNRRASSIPDVDGVRSNVVAVPGFAAVERVLTTGVAVSTIVDELNARGYPAVASQDAGSYVCNALYFDGLMLAAERQIPCLFVHIPPLGAVVKDEAGATHRWTLQALQDGVALVLDWLGESL
jgi:pyroglutamyl-peptidase